MKPTVHYDATKFVAITLGGSAFVHPVDHPNHIVGHAVSNTKIVKTSKVVFYNETTGEFETLNTLYKPCGPNSK